MEYFGSSESHWLLKNQNVATHLIFTDLVQMKASRVSQIFSGTPTESLILLKLIIRVYKIDGLTSMCGDLSP